MKKRSLVVMLGVMCVLAGCGGKKVTDTYQWPRTEIAAQLPQPESPNGKLSGDYDDMFFLDVANMTKEDYDKYVTACEDKGFTIDHMKGDDYFSANNSEGYSLSLSYSKKEKQMSITIYAPSEETSAEETSEEETSAEAEAKSEETTVEETTETTTEAATEAETTAEETKAENTSSTGIRPEIKELLDSYESCMNEYADFMKKYQSSNNPASMIVDYGKMMAKYSEFADKYSKLDTTDMNNDELKYYMDVTNRVNQKLIDVAS